jgi:serine/threonine-protein kinase
MKACPKCGKRFLGNEEFCPSDGATLKEMEQDKIGDPLVGTTVDGRYQIDKKIGEGGMGMVYLATHAMIGNRCALKVLRGELSGEGEVAERFIQEARAAAAIGNDHIIQITDFGQLPDGAAYFVMEFLDGKALHDIIEDNPQMPVERVIDVMVQCCEALSAAHSSNIVHRDLKPDNIFLVKKGAISDFVKILDFGIAKVASGETGKRLTKTGMIFGTPQYMSPEQAAGTGVDARTDIYALGIIMYEMLCGHVPFEADTFMGVLTKHLYEEPIPPRRLVPPVGVDQNLEAVLLKAIAKKPERRYQSMEEFASDLTAIAEGRTPSIVYDQMRDTAATTVPPPPPSSVVGKSRRAAPPGKAQPRPLWPIFAGVGVAAVASVVVAVLLLGGGEDGKEAKADPVVQPVALDPAPVTPAPTSAAEPEPTYVMISAGQPGAMLYNEKGAMLGPLPFRVVRPHGEDAEVSYVVKLKGFQDAVFAVTPGTPDAFDIALQEVAAQASADGGKKSSGGGKASGGAAVKPTSGGGKAASGGDEIEVKVKGKKKSGVQTDLADPWAN